MGTDSLVIHGAREHNLKNVTLELPRDRLIVFTGLSGSGKSSLAFDTIYAEGQRRYVESLSAYARQFLGQMEKPDVDFIEGLSPAISIDQKSTSRNPRSTVGTITEVYDYLRVLYARVGHPHCYNCGRPIGRQTPDQIVDQVMELPEGTRFQVLAPVVRGRKGEYGKLLDELARKGFPRARIDGEVRELSEPIRLAKTYKHTIEVVVDRLVAKPDIRRRVADSIETALELAEGIASIAVQTHDGGEELQNFSQSLACTHCGLSFDEMAPRNFSFNSPYGACPTCDGLGTRLEVDPELVVPDADLSVREGALAPWASATLEYWNRVLEAVAEAHDIDLDMPFRKLLKKQRDVLLTGSDEQIHVRYKNRYGRQRSYWTTYEGVLTNVERRHRETDSESQREKLEQFMREIPCRACKGARLRPETLAVTVAGANIAELTDRSIRDTLAFVDTIELSERETMIAERLLKEIRERLRFLVDVGLDYLSLSRPAATLAGGEAQRIRLATQIGSGLVGVLYILDEPSIGLHQRDNKRLIDTLVRLRDLGNTLVVVEHDEATILEADHIVDIGPLAGEHGGEIVYSGDLKGLLECDESITGAFLSGRRQIPTPEVRRRPTGRKLRLEGVRAHNLQNVTVDVPLGLFVCVTGVSGSGKSTLVQDVLLRILMQKVYRSRLQPGKHKRLVGWEQVDKIVDIDQSPIGRTPRSNPATYTGVFDHVRKLFAQVPEAKLRGLPAGPLLVQRARRTLRALRGRRPDQDRDALPARRLRDVRGVQGPALQPRDARGALQGPVDRRRAGDERRRGPRVLPAHPAHQAAHADALRRRARVREARPARADALGRRGAAHQAELRAAQAGDRQHAVRARRADDRAALRGRAQAALGAAAARRHRQHGARDRAQPRRHQDRRLADRPRPRGRRPGRHDRRHGHARSRCGRARLAHRAVPRRGARAPAAAARGVRGPRALAMMPAHLHGARRLLVSPPT